LPFEFSRLEIPDVILVKPKVFEDERGYFMETYKKTDFEKAGITANFVQDNQSFSKQGVLRGLHFQREPYAQAKLVRVVKGVIFDVAVDIRKSSPTFGKWVAAILSEHNKWQLYIPRGFAHGFLVLSDFAVVTYKVDNVYSPEHDAGIIWNDPDINIPWPVDKPVISKKDGELPTLREAVERGWCFE